MSYFNSSGTDFMSFWPNVNKSEQILSYFQQFFNSFQIMFNDNFWQISTNLKPFWTIFPNKTLKVDLRRWSRRILMIWGEIFQFLNTICELNQGFMFSFKAVELLWCIFGVCAVSIQTSSVVKWQKPSSDNVLLFYFLVR